MCIWWWFFLQVVGTPNHFMMSSIFFPSQVVGTLKPSITCLSLPSLPSLPASPPCSLPCPLTPCLAPHSLHCPSLPASRSCSLPHPSLPCSLSYPLAPCLAPHSPQVVLGSPLPVGSEGSKGARGQDREQEGKEEQGGETGSKGARQGAKGQDRKWRGEGVSHLVKLSLPDILVFSVLTGGSKCRSLFIGS